MVGLETIFTDVSIEVKSCKRFRGTICRSCYVALFVRISWGSKIQNIDGRSQSSTLVERPKEDSTDIWFTTISFMESVVAI